MLNFALLLLLLLGLRLIWIVNEFNFNKIKYCCNSEIRYYSNEIIYSADEIKINDSIFV